MTKPWREQSLFTRLYLEPHLHQLARFISYGGKRPRDVEAFLVEYRLRHGERKVESAMWELTVEEPATKLIVLRPEGRRACRVLLGPPPESGEYADYWQKQGRQPPADHQSPFDLPPAAEDDEPAKAPKKAARRAQRKRPRKE